MTMSVAALKMRKWTVLGAALAMILAVSVAFGQAPTACEVTYLTSGPTAEKTSLRGTLRNIWGDSSCARQRRADPSSVMGA